MMIPRAVVRAVARRMGSLDGALGVSAGSACAAAARRMMVLVLRRRW